MPGDRVKTDRRDALQRARMSAIDTLEPLWVPDSVRQATRDVIRFRADLKITIRRHRQQIQHFLLQQNRRFQGMLWTDNYRAWLKDLKFGHSAQRIRP